MRKLAQQYDFDQVKKNQVRNNVFVVTKLWTK